MQSTGVGVLYHRSHCTQDILTNSIKYCPVINKILTETLGDEIVPHHDIRSG